jgi:hypothetical protein
MREENKRLGKLLDNHDGMLREAKKIVMPQVFN